MSLRVERRAVTGTRASRRAGPSFRSGSNDSSEDARSRAGPRPPTTASAAPRAAGRGETCAAAGMVAAVRACGYELPRNRAVQIAHPGDAAAIDDGPVVRDQPAVVGALEIGQVLPRDGDRGGAGGVVG